MKAFAVIGFHHTGKTTVVTNLIRSLSLKGYKVATIKDIHNENYHSDTEGKNSWKHIQAGSVMTIARGLYDSSLIYPYPLTLRAMADLVQCDYLIIEGMKTAPVPKILCAESVAQLDALHDDTVMAISGIIANTKPDWQEPLILDAETEIEQLTQLVIDKVFDLLPDNDPACCAACGLNCYELAGAILKGERLRTDCVSDQKQEITVSVDGRTLPLNPFVQNILKDVLQGFVSNLRGYDPDGNITIEIKHHA